MAEQFTAGTYAIPAPRPEEDAASAYMETANSQQALADDDEWGELLGDGGTAQVTAPAAPGKQQATPATGAPVTPAAEEQVADTPQAAPEDTGAAQAQSWQDFARAAMSDLGEGIVEAPRQAVGGVLDAFSEAGQFLGEATGLGAIQFRDPETGAFDLDLLSREELLAQEEEFGTQGLVDFLSPEEGDTTTGAFVRGTAQFLTGFLPALKGTRALGITGAVSSSAVAGAVADVVVFDPHEDRLSTYLNEFPALEPFVSDYLADNNPENESSWEGRFKNALEGAGLGLATDGATSLFRAMKYYKAQRSAASQFAPGSTDASVEAAKDAAADAARRELVPEVGEDALATLGRADGPLIASGAEGEAARSDLIQRTQQYFDQIGQGEATDTAREIAAGTAGREERTYINHARIQSPDDVRQAIQEMADLGAADIEEATRGTVTNVQTIRESSREYRDLDDLIGRPPGPMTAAQAVASRKLLTSSGEQLVDLARLAAAPNASAADVYSFRRAMSVHYAIQSEVVAARTETARALQSWAIPTGSDKARGEAINQLIRNGGGAGDLQSLAKAVAIAGDNPVAVNTMARETLRSRTGKALYQVWINGLLSSPKTHIVNALSNSMVAAYSIPERYMAAGISKAFYRGEIDTGEVGAQMFGLVKGVRDGFRLMFEGNKAAGAGGDLSDLFDNFAKTEVHGNDISAEAFGLDPAGAWGRGFDLLGRTVNLPGSLLEVSDRMFKSMAYRSELNALAYRNAASQGLDGEDMARSIAETLSNPPESLAADALDVAHYNTFTNELGKTGQAFQKAVRQIPGAKLVLPFIRTPTNIVKYTFARTPLAYMSSAIRADLKAGGARAAQAHARVALGSMIMLYTADMATEGTVTGRGPEDFRMRKIQMQEGWQPYSVKVGGRYYQYSRTDPIGMMMGLGADIAELTTNANDEESEMMATAAVLALANNLANKTYMSGIYDFIGAMDPSNPTNDPGKYIQQFAGGMVPFSSFIRNVAGTVDPILRETRGAVTTETGEDDAVATYFETLLASVRTKIPGMGSDLPPRRDLFGKPIDRSSGIGWAYDLISPIASRADKPDPITRVLIENKVPVSAPPRVISGVRLNAEEYSEFTRIAGESLQERLGALVKNPQFKRLSGGPDGMKSELIMDVVRGSRDIARAQMLRDNPRLQRLSSMRQLERLQTLQGQ